MPGIELPPGAELVTPSNSGQLELPPGAELVDTTLDVNVPKLKPTKALGSIERKMGGPDAGVAVGAYREAKGIPKSLMRDESRPTTFDQPNGPVSNLITGAITAQLQQFVKAYHAATDEEKTPGQRVAGAVGYTGAGLLPGAGPIISGLSEKAATTPKEAAGAGLVDAVMYLVARHGPEVLKSIPPEVKATLKDGVEKGKIALKAAGPPVAGYAIGKGLSAIHPELGHFGGEVGAAFGLGMGKAPRTVLKNIIRNWLDIKDTEAEAAKPKASIPSIKPMLNGSQAARKAAEAQGPKAAIPPIKPMNRVEPTPTGPKAAIPPLRPMNRAPETGPKAPIPPLRPMNRVLETPAETPKPKAPIPSIKPMRNGAQAARNATSEGEGEVEAEEGSAPETVKRYNERQKSAPKANPEKTEKAVQGARGKVTDFPDPAASKVAQAPNIPYEKVEKLIKKLEPEPQVPISTGRLRDASGLSKESFDALMLKFRKEGKVYLSEHDHPNQLSAADRDKLIDGGDGKYYVAVSTR